MTLDPVSAVAILVALWALWRTRPRDVVINWNAPVITSERRLGRKIARIMAAHAREGRKR